MQLKYLERWELKASVRSIPRRFFNDTQTGYFYPLSRQPICLHPIIQQLGDQVKHYILAQSFYRYANEISIIETRVVNQSAMRIANNLLPVRFPDSFRAIALTIIVDEAYHAYVALDALKQIEEYTQIKPLNLPNQIEIEKAISLVEEKLDPKYHHSFALIAVALAENTLTKEIVTMIDKAETHPFFQFLIKDHLSDESRHSAYFKDVLEFFWSNLDEESKREILPHLPNFIINYLDTTIQKRFDRKVLESLHLPQEEINLILEDIYEGYVLSETHPMVKNLLFLLNKSGILTTENSQELFKKWIEN